MSDIIDYTQVPPPAQVGKPNRLLQAALYYASRGWRLVPNWHVVGGVCSCKKGANCANPGKHPRINDWPRTASCDPEQVKAWWGEWPNANIGIATGEKSNLVVLDVDPRHGGEESLLHLISEYGRLPDTIESLTGGGGRHILFSHPGFEIRNVQGSKEFSEKLGPGLDIRGDGGQFIAPPSTHASGACYEWEVNSKPSQTDLAAMPAWMANLLSKKTAHPAQKERRNGNAPHIPDRITEGARNNTLTSVAGSLRKRGLSPEEILPSLREVNQRCEPPLDDEDLIEIANSIGRYPAGDLEQGSLTEDGNALRLVKRHGHKLRWIDEWGWMAWDGRRWKRDSSGAPMRWAKETARSIYQEAAQTPDERQARELGAWASKSLSASRLNSALYLAQTELKADTDSFDQNPFLLNCQNGTLDLTTGQLTPHDPRQLITKVAGTYYDPEATCPTWLSFLERVLGGDWELISFIKRAIGYTLTGGVGEQVLFFPYGSGANGKSTFIQVLLSLLADYSRQAAPSILLMGDRHPTEIAALQGARFVATIEVEEGRRMAEVLVKQLTGGDRLTARFMHRDFFQFEPTFKLWLVANHLPEIRGTDHAIWRRILQIPFNVTIPEGERDPNMGERLKAELPGILAWAVEGCMDWQATGLQIPEAVRKATSDYRAEMDIIAAFIQECCIANDLASCTAGRLHDAFTKWGGDMSQRKFSRALAERGFSTRDAGGKPIRDGAGRAIIRGLGLLSSEASEASEAKVNN